MLHKKSFALLLFLMVAFAAMSQEDTTRFWNRVDGLLNTAEERLGPSPRNANEESPFFSIVNNTGFVIREVFVRKAGETSWGRNLLVQPLYNGQNISVRLDRSFDQTALYSVRMVDIDGDIYAQYDLAIKERTVIRMGIGDFEWNK